MQVVGQDRPPGMKDKGNLPFTEATILEIQRLGSIGEYWTLLSLMRRRDQLRCPQFIYSQISSDTFMRTLSLNVLPTHDYLLSLVPLVIVIKH